MAQKRFFNFRDNVESFALSEYLLGIVGAGLYEGFTFSPTNNLTLTLTQTDGELITKQDGTTENVGVWVTKQGTVVREVDDIVLPISASTQPRIDLIVARHNYIQVVGGQNATYEVVQGVEGLNPSPPNVPNNENAIILGELRLPANCTALDQAEVVYIKSEKVDIGNTPKLNSPLGSIQINQVTTNGNAEYLLESNVTAVDDGSWNNILTTGVYIGRLTECPVGFGSQEEEHGIVEVYGVQYELEDTENFWHVHQKFTSIITKEVYVRSLQGDNDGNGQPVPVSSVPSQYENDINGWRKVGYNKFGFNNQVDERLALVVDRRLKGLIEAGLDATGIQNVPLIIKGFVVNKQLDTPSAGQSTFTWTAGTIYHDGQVYEVPHRSVGIIGLNSDSVQFTVTGIGNAKQVNISVGATGTFSEPSMRRWNTPDYETVDVDALMTSHYIANSGLDYKISNGVLYLIGLVTVHNNRTSYDDAVFYLPVKVAPLVPSPSFYVTATKRYYLSGNSNILRFQGFESGDVIPINLSIPLG